MPESPAVSSRTPLVLALVLALAFGIRLWRIDQKNLWLDESTSWSLATGSVPALIEGAAADIHPPLYYLVLKAWVAIAGDSAAGMRSLSALASVVALLLLFRLGAGFVSPAVRLAALAWLAFSPHMINYAQEARMYACATAAVLAACLAYRRWFDSAFTKTSALVAVVVFGAVSIYLHYFTALAILAMWAHLVVAAALGAWRTTSPRPSAARILVSWALANIAIAVLYLPWVRIAIAQITRGQSWRQVVTIADIPDHAIDLARMVSFGYYGSRLFVSPLGGAITLVAAIGLLLLVWRALSPGRHERDIFLLCAIAVPVSLSLAALPKTGHMDLSRYLAFVLPLSALGVARGLDLLGGRVAVLALGIAAAASVPFAAAYFADPVRDSDVRPIVAYLDAHAARSGEPVTREPIAIAPGYMDDCARFAARGGTGLTFDRIESPEALASLLNKGSAAWLILDYRWGGFDALAKDSRVRETDVPGGHSAMMRLYRLGQR